MKDKIISDLRSAMSETKRIAQEAIREKSFERRLAIQKGALRRVNEIKNLIFIIENQ